LLSSITDRERKALIKDLKYKKREELMQQLQQTLEAPEKFLFGKSPTDKRKTSADKVSESKHKTVTLVDNSVAADETVEISSDKYVQLESEDKDIKAEEFIAKESDEVISPLTHHIPSETSAADKLTQENKDDTSQVLMDYQWAKTSGEDIKRKLQSMTYSILGDTEETITSYGLAVFTPTEKNQLDMNQFSNQAQSSLMKYVQLDLEKDLHMDLFPFT
jgi:hypothetical protein